MLVWSDFKEDGKWRREKDVFGCLVEGEKEERFWWDPSVFSPPPPKHNLSKLERKWEWKLDKIAHIFFLLLLFFFWATSTWRNKCGLPTIFFSFFSFGFHSRWFFFFFLYDDVHQCMNPWFTIVPVPFFFERFCFLIF